MHADQHCFNAFLTRHFRFPAAVTLVLALGVLALANHACAQGTALTNADVVGMVKAGIPAQVISTKIGAAPCAFDISTQALAGLNKAGVPPEIMSQMVLAKCGSAAVAAVTGQTWLAGWPSLPAVSDQERATVRGVRDRCPRCPVLVVFMLDDSGPHIGLMTKNQLNFLQDTAKKTTNPSFYLTSHDWADADYVLVWTEGTKVYTYNFLQSVRQRATTTTTANSTATTIGNVGGVPVYGSTAGTTSGESTTSTTTYVPETGSRTAQIFNLQIYDAKTGELEFRTTHSGYGYRWQKPDKACVEDAVKWMRAWLPNRQNP